jgi:hypothetical protein
MNREVILMPADLTDEMAEAIAASCRCCGGGAFEIWEAIKKAAPKCGTCRGSGFTRELGGYTSPEEVVENCPDCVFHESFELK